MPVLLPWTHDRKQPQRTACNFLTRCAICYPSQMLTQYIAKSWSCGLWLVPFAASCTFWDILELWRICEGLMREEHLLAEHLFICIGFDFSQCHLIIRTNCATYLKKLTMTLENMWVGVRDVTPERWGKKKGEMQEPVKQWKKTPSTLH